MSVWPRGLGWALAAFWCVLLGASEIARGVIVERQRTAPATALPRGTTQGDHAFAIGTGVVLVAVGAVCGWRGHRAHTRSSPHWRP